MSAPSREDGVALVGVERKERLLEVLQVAKDAVSRATRLVTRLTPYGLFAIAANDVSAEGIGFESGDNKLSLVFADGRVEQSGRQTKLACAVWLFERLLEQEKPQA